MGSVTVSVTMQGPLPSLLLPLLLILTAAASPSPKERLKVKYRVKQGEKPVKVHSVPVQSKAENLNHSVEKDSNEILNSVNSEELMAEARSLLLASTPSSYRHTVTTVMGQLERTARSQDMTIGDLILDLVKEIVAETVGGLVTRALGINTARSSGSFTETILKAIASVGEDRSCR